MAKYPKITGNISGASKFDRLKSPLYGLPAHLGGINQNYLVKKLTDSAGNETVFAVVVIESSGDSGSFLNVSNIHLKDEADALTQAGTGNTNATQQDLFCLTPLKKTGSDAYTDNNPYMASQLSDMSVENLYSTLATDSDYVATDLNTEADGAASFMKFSLTSEKEIVWEAEGTALADCTAVIPVYTHAYVVANPIPAGSYAAILVKCNTLGTSIFDGSKTNTLTISHDGDITGQESSSDYTLTLSINAENLFELSATFNGSPVTHNATTGLQAQRMMYVPDDLYSGFTWPTNYLTNSFYNSQNSSSIGTPSTETEGPLSPAGNPINAQQYSTIINGAAGHISNTDILEAMFSNGVSTFDSAGLIIRDGSPFPEAFMASSSQKDGILLTQSSQGAVARQSISSGSAFTQSIKQGFSSSITSEGTMTKVSGSNTYQNFSIATATVEDTTTYTLDPQSTPGSEEVSMDVKIPYAVYPIFSYSATTIGREGSLANSRAEFPAAAIVAAASNMNFNIHSGDVHNSFDALGATVISPINTAKAYSAVKGHAAADTKMKLVHNVRINCHNANDVLDRNGLAGPAIYGNDSSTVSTARVSDGEDGFDTTSTVVAADLSPTNGSMDYTILSTVDSTEPKVGFLGRNVDGSYTGHEPQGYNKVDTVFSAPVTCWKPGYAEGEAIGFDRVPYFNEVGATPSKLTLTTGYYSSRPLFHLGYSGGTVGVVNIDRFEFLGPNTVVSGAVTPLTGYAPTGASLTNGLFDYGTEEYREVSDAFSSTASGTTFTHVSNGATLPTSYVEDMEIFDVPSSVITDTAQRKFVGNVTAGSNSTKTTMTIKDVSGTLIAANNLSSTFTFKIGKPTFAANSRNTSFTHAVDAVRGTEGERDRVNSIYGSDLSYRAHTTETYIKLNDEVVVSSIGTEANVNSLHAGSSSAANQKFSCNSNSVLATAGTSSLDIVNYSPEEVGIEINTSTMLSARYYDSSAHLDVYGGTECQMFYKTLTSDDFAGSAYSKTLTFYPFNEGEEDVFISHAELTDPYYLPQGVFTSQPAGSLQATWTLTATSTREGDNNKAYTKAAPLTGASKDPSDAGHLASEGTLHKLQKRMGTNAEPWNNNNSTSSKIDVGFSVDTNNYVTGSYYKVLEINYYRDISANQRYWNGSSWVMREFGNQNVWKTRKLIKVDINASSGITLSDVDENSLTESSTILFGTINA